MSPFRYPGGKNKASVKKKILSYFPNCFSEYREPFCGGGGIFFATKLERPNIQYWINDINPDLMSVYLEFQNNADEFIKLCRQIEPMKHGELEVYPTSNSSGKKYNARLKSHFDNFVNHPEKYKRALRYFFINHTVWGGRVTYDPSKKSRLYFSNPQGWNIVIKHNKLESVSEILKDAKITCLSYEELLSVEGDDVFIYLDPPYMVNSELDRQSQLYEYNFDFNDHIKLSELVKLCKHKVLISYDDNDKIRQLYDTPKFTIHKEEWTYCGTSSAKSQPKTKKVGQELIITNY